jgi:sulfur dioxygenase
MMDVAVPANMRIGLARDTVAAKGLALLATEAVALVRHPEVAFIDVQEESERRERKRHGSIAGALHSPYFKLSDCLGAGGLIEQLSRTRNIFFYCA